MIFFASEVDGIDKDRKTSKIAVKYKQKEQLRFCWKDANREKLLYTEVKSVRSSFVRPLWLPAQRYLGLLWRGALPKTK